MKSATICLTILCGILLCTTASWSQKWNRCDPRYYFITPADRSTYREQAAKAMAEMRVAIGEENTVSGGQCEPLGEVILSPE